MKGSAARFTGSHLEWEFAQKAIESLACDGHPCGGRCPFGRVDLRQVACRLLNALFAEFAGEGSAVHA